MYAGSMFLVWFGPTARVTISDPALLREIFVLKSEFFEKNDSPPVVKKLEGDGLLSLKGEKWAHHRKIITPTFYLENLKVCIYVIKPKPNSYVNITYYLLSENICAYVCTFS